MEQQSEDPEEFDITSLQLDLGEIDEDEFNIPNNVETPTLESILNEQDDEDLPTTEVDYHDHVENTSSIGGDILRHIVLRSVSTQLCSACDRVNAGNPTVMCVSSIICVGTSHGLVLVFDSSQTLKWCHEGDLEQGAVTALGLNVDCTRLLAGYSRGLILMFNVTEAGKVLRRMTDVHSPSTGVLHVKFTDCPNIAVCSDTGGSVFQLTLKRTLGVRSVESKCLFSGSRGEVCVIEPLYLHHLPSHPLQGHVILAMATLSKVIIVSIKPQMKVLLTRSVSVSPVSLPLLSWQFVIIQLSQTSRIMDPVLAFARDNCIYFFQVNVFENGKMQGSLLQQLNFNYCMISCHWMNPRILVTIDSNEVLHLIEVRSKEQLESVDLSSVKLVYNSSHFKGLSTGGNVSQAMALAGEKACYNTIQSFGNQLLLLGVRSFHVFTIRSWDNRIDLLVDQDKFIDAIKLGIEFLEEKNKIAFGLVGSQNERSKSVRNKVLNILDVYINRMLDWRDVDIQAICEFCFYFKITDKLFGQVWRSVENITSRKKVFLNMIEKFILREKLTQVPAGIMQQLLLHQESLGSFKTLEECVISVDIDCLDIELVIGICKKHHLHDALIAVWNRAMLDYITPLHQLIPLLNCEGDVQTLGNKLLVYISSCLSGRGYPTGEIDESRRSQVRQQVCQCLCIQHTLNADDDEAPYPYLRALLKFNTRDFLNALAIAQLPSSFQQRLFDVLKCITMDSQSNSFKPSEAGYVFAFIAGNATKKVYVDQVLFENVLNLLVDSTSEDLDSRQDAFLALVKAIGVLNENRIFELAKKAKFYKVCSLILEERGDENEVIKFLLLDHTRKARVFDLIENSKNKSGLEPFIIENIKQFVQVDRVKSGRCLQMHFPSSFSKAVTNLQDEDKYHFLKGGLSIGDLSSSDITLFLQLACHYEPSSVLTHVKVRNDFKMDPVLQSCRTYGLEEAEAVLLEKSGDYQGAFDILFRRLESAIETNGDIENATENIVKLGERASKELNPQTTWLPLLQCLHKLESRDILKRILDSASLNLAAEFHLLLQHTTGLLGDFRTLITGLFEKCKHEENMLQSSLETLRTDLQDDLAVTIEQSLRGVYMADEGCAQCKLDFSGNKSLVLFNCGHGFHSDCTNTPPESCELCTPQPKMSCKS